MFHIIENGAVGKIPYKYMLKKDLFSKLFVTYILLYDFDILTKMKDYWNSSQRHFPV
jgi:hypothetical protein